MRLSTVETKRMSGFIPLDIKSGTSFILSINVTDINSTLSFSFSLRNPDGSDGGTAALFSVSEIGYVEKNIVYDKDIQGVRLYFRIETQEDSFVEFSSFQIEKGEVASAYVPYYYAPAVNGVRLFTDSAGGYLGYKTFDNVIAYGYFGPTVEKIFWANDVIENKGVFNEGWQLTDFSMSNIYNDDTYILYYSENYQLYYNDTVYVELKDDSGYFGFLKNGFNSVFGDSIEPGALVVGLLVVIVGIAIVKKILK